MTLVLFFFFFYFTSLQEDRADAISNASAIVSSTKGESVMVSS